MQIDSLIVELKYLEHCSACFSTLVLLAENNSIFDRKDCSVFVIG